jgi:hypothetical protein
MSCVVLGACQVFEERSFADHFLDGGEADGVNEVCGVAFAL